MRADIKCADCGKMTRHVELGELYYDIDDALQTVVVKERIGCPKCKADISDRRYMVKKNYFFMRIFAANFLLMGEAEERFTVPQHLQGVIPLEKQQHNIIAPQCKARLQFVKKF